MKNIDLLKAFNYIDDKYIEEAMPEVYKEKKTSMFKKLFPVLGMATMTLLIYTSFKSDISNCFVPNSDVPMVGTTYEGISGDTEDIVSTDLVKYSSLEEAEAVIGFKTNIEVLGYDNLRYYITDKNVLNVIYEGENENFDIKISKDWRFLTAVKISLKEEPTTQINNVDVYFGQDEGNSFAVFIHNGKMYSITSSTLDLETLKTFVNKITS